MALGIDGVNSTAKGVGDQVPEQRATDTPKAIGRSDYGYCFGVENRTQGLPL
jgi:hypothetical protein